MKINPNGKQNCLPGNNPVNNPLRASKGKQLFPEVTLSSVCIQFGRTSRIAVANSSTSRFGKANENDMNDILQFKDSKIQKMTLKLHCKHWRHTLLKPTKTCVNLCDCSPEQLAELLRNFYIDVRKKDGTSYKLSALKGIRFGLSRHFARELEIEMCQRLLNTYFV